MQTFIRRASKYALYLIILLCLIFVVMNAFRSPSEVSLIDQMLKTSSGLMMLVVVVVFSAIYPFMGYVKRTLTFDASQKADELTNVMGLCGYSRVDRNESSDMVFRATGKMKRLSMMYEDQITIKTVDGLSVIEGPRKEVVRAAFRFDTFIN